MSKTIIRLALAVWITSTLSGCGTFMNVSDREDISLMRDGPKKVYGGVSWDAGSGGEYLAEVVKPNETLLDRLQALACGTYLVAIDLPLSIVGDTLTLPFTIPAAMGQTETHQNNEASKPGPSGEVSTASGRDSSLKHDSP